MERSAPRRSATRRSEVRCSEADCAALHPPYDSVEAMKNQFGTQAAVRISPNSRGILRQEAPAVSVT